MAEGKNLLPLLLAPRIAFLTHSPKLVPASYAIVGRGGGGGGGDPPTPCSSGVRLSGAAGGGKLQALLWILSSPPPPPKLAGKLPFQGGKEEGGNLCHLLTFLSVTRGQRPVAVETSCGLSRAEPCLHTRWRHKPDLSAHTKQQSQKESRSGTVCRRPGFASRREATPAHCKDGAGPLSPLFIKMLRG